ncbi:hypothetical protein [Jeotgalibacillus proteolyticus]|nr:hypothetical protein [Jeotgalibacillus proteolyticus]
MSQDLELILMKRELQRLQEDYLNCSNQVLKNPLKMDIELLSAFFSQYA